MKVDDGGKMGAIAHQEAILAVDDGAARTGDEDAPMVLPLFPLPVVVSLDDLPIREAGAEIQNEDAENEVEDPQSQVGISVYIEHHDRRAAEDSGYPTAPRSV